MVTQSRCHLVVSLHPIWCKDMKLTVKLKKAILAHAEQCYPGECCGVIVGKEYIPCRNIAQHQQQFEIHHEDLANAEDKGEILAYVHSHPDGSAQPSQVDLVQMNLHKKPWVICSYPDGDIQLHKPTGYQSPLVGRNYFHGLQDCYSLIRDFYSREYGIPLPDFERSDKWWEDANHQPLYLDNFGKAGFVEVDTPKRGDVLLCRVGRTEHVNHAVIYLADDASLKSEQTEPCIGSALILHHPYGRKSVREVYGQQWIERTVKVLRHVEND